MDQETLDALERAAALDERNKSDWIRLVLRKELRRLGLLPHGAGKGKMKLRRG
jgi:hypothetical protein